MFIVLLLNERNRRTLLPQCDIEKLDQRVNSRVASLRVEMVPPPPIPYRLPPTPALFVYHRHPPLSLLSSLCHHRHRLTVVLFNHAPSLISCRLFTPISKNSLVCLTSQLGTLFSREFPTDRLYKTARSTVRLICWSIGP